jgi:hypothetical protein
LRNHFQEALGNKYIDEDCYKSFFGKINEIGYLLNRMMKGVRTARDLHENEKRSKRSSRRSLPGLPKLLSEASLPFRRDKFQRETLYSSRRLNQQYIQTDQTDLSRLPCNESVRGEMPFSYLTGTKQTRQTISTILLTTPRIFNKFYVKCCKQEFIPVKQQPGRRWG